jgi:hypothetical protein
MIRELATVIDSLKAGRPVEPITVRTFLSWFGAQRRGWQIVHQIRCGRPSFPHSGTQLKLDRRVNPPRLEVWNRDEVGLSKLLHSTRME